MLEVQLCLRRKTKRRALQEWCSHSRSLSIHLSDAQGWFKPPFAHNTWLTGGKVTLPCQKANKLSGKHESVYVTHPGCGLKFLCVPHVCQALGFVAQWVFFGCLTTWVTQTRIMSLHKHRAPSSPPTSSQSANPASSVSGFGLGCKPTQRSDC